MEYLSVAEEQKNYKKMLQEMLSDYDKLTEELKSTDNADDAQRLEQEYRALKREMQEIGHGKFELEQTFRNYKDEKKAIEKEIEYTKGEIRSLQNTRNQKIETLKRLQNGNDAIQAMKWLADHRDEFRGKIYDPILMDMDVKNPSVNAKYVENTIAIRDLVAFAAETADDANKLMKQFREVMNLKVNVIQVDPNADPNRMRARSGDIKNPEFKGKTRSASCGMVLRLFLLFYSLQGGSLRLEEQDLLYYAKLLGEQVPPPQLDQIDSRGPFGVNSTLEFFKVIYAIYTMQSGRDGGN